MAKRPKQRIRKRTLVDLLSRNMQRRDPARTKPIDLRSKIHPLTHTQRRDLN